MNRHIIIIIIIIIASACVSTRSSYYKQRVLDQWEASHCVWTEYIEKKTSIVLTRQYFKRATKRHAGVESTLLIALSTKYVIRCCRCLSMIGFILSVGRFVFWEVWIGGLSREKARGGTPLGGRGACLAGIGLLFLCLLTESTSLWV